MRTDCLSTQDAGSLVQGIQMLKQGNVIAAPTDTVYGVVCRFDLADAIDDLYAAKDRPAQKPLPILVGEVSQLEQVVAPPVPALAALLIEQFWPGPLTLVLPARAALPPRLTAGGDTVGVRMPDHPVLLHLARSCGPLASSSANRSGGPECTTAEQVMAQLDGVLPLVLDGGETGGQGASTVAQLIDNQIQILRPGPIAEQVLAVAARHADGQGNAT